MKYFLSTIFENLVRIITWCISWFISWGKICVCEVTFFLNFVRYFKYVPDVLTTFPFPVSTLKISLYTKITSWIRSSEYKVPFDTFSISEIERPLSTDKFDLIRPSFVSWSKNWLQDALENYVLISQMLTLSLWRN